MAALALLPAGGDQCRHRHGPVKVFHRSKRRNNFTARTKPFSQAAKTAGNRDTIQSLPIKQRSSIMWSIVTALIYYFIIVPGWRLTSGDTAKIRGAGFQKDLRRVT
jgi:hypothetical protein